MNIWLTFLMIGTIFFTLGFIFLMIGLARKNQRKGWEQTTGEIVSDSSIPGSLISFPTVQFKANDGQEYRVRSNFKQTPGLAIGRKVGVYYDPFNPKSAQIDTLAQNGMVFTIIGSVLIGLTALGGLILFSIWFIFFS